MASGQHDHRCAGAIHGWVGLAEPGSPTFQLFGITEASLPFAHEKVGRKRKKQSSFPKGYVTLLRTSMAAEKASSEDYYDGM